MRIKALGSLAGFLVHEAHEERAGKVQELFAVVSGFVVIPPSFRVQNARAEA